MTTAADTTGEYGHHLFDIDADTARSPQQMYRALLEMRKQGGPLVRMEGAGVIVCTRDEVETVFRHPEIFSSGMAATDLSNVRPLIPLQIDPPDHKKFRKILDPLLAPQKMRLLEDPVTRIANHYIDSFIDDDEIDFVKQFSIPFHSHVYLSILGPPLEDVELLISLRDGITRPHYLVGKPIEHPDTVAYRNQIGPQIYEYFQAQLDERERTRQDDLLSNFLDAEIDGRRLTREEILDICFLLLIAGMDTVSGSLEVFWAHLAEHPERRRQLVGDPSVILPTIEELIRWETTTPAVTRITTQDTELGGCPIAAGEPVSVLIAAANLDKDELPDADEVRFDRKVNRHLSFGGGVHRCLGSHLARLELRVALREWHARIPNYKIKPATELRFIPGQRSLESLPLLLGVSS
jgi:cytochrome P450